MRQTSMLCISFIKACETIFWTSLNNPRIKLAQKWVLWIDGKSGFGAETQYVQRWTPARDHSPRFWRWTYCVSAPNRFFGFDRKYDFLALSAGVWTMAKMRDGAQWLSNHYAANDYYCEGEHVVGSWVGRGAEAL